jgi:hypothetical protein
MTPLRSAVRVFTYTLIGSLLSSGVFTAFNNAVQTGSFDLSILAKGAFAAITAGVVAVLAYAYNYLEDSGTIPSTKGTTNVK